MRLIIFLAALAAFASAGAIAISGPGTRFGLWDYSFGLSIIRSLAQPIPVADNLSLSPIFTVAGLALSGAAAAAFLRRFGLAVFAAIAAVAALAAGMVPIKMRELARANPFIHDITTDFENPPQILAAAGEARKNPAPYSGGDLVRDSQTTVSEAQRAAFPDIAPLTVAADLQAAADAARRVLDDMNMQVLAEGPGAETGSGWRIEAVATSFWYGFKDDFIVRLTPQDSGTRIDVRSKSRVGLSDLGANAKRVREFLARLDALL